MQKLKCICLLFPAMPVFAKAQVLKNTVFNNVIRIDRNDVARKGENYLVDIPMPQDGASVICFNDARVSNALLCTSLTSYSFLTDITVISPDWAYYDAAAAHALQTGIICAEPVTTGKLFHVKKDDKGGIKTDSFIIKGTQPVLHFRNPGTMPADMIKVYYSEGYGSVCCPRDPRWDNISALMPFVADFEKRHHVKIRGTYTQVYGKEGEHNIFLTLEGLSLQQKLEFILERSRAVIPNKELKPIVLAPRIFFPYYVSKKGLKSGDSG
ncbi:hypothetical protein ACTHGU_00600 [Chitinophagaceae bacterium MMS25-I14]